MTDDVKGKADALAKWEWGCPAIEQKGQFVRDGNWHPLSQLLRHKDCESAQVTVVEQEGSTILKIEPAKFEGELPSGKSLGKRPAFHLIVR